MEGAARELEGVARSEREDPSRDLEDDAPAYDLEALVVGVGVRVVAAVGGIASDRHLEAVGLESAAQ